MIKLSVITINYNNLLGLQKTMKSVFEQTYENIEYIIIDGDSNDGSAAYIKEHADLLTYWVSEPDNGIYHAMNKGIDMAAGSYLLFLNSGDWLNHENTIKSVIEKNPTSDVLYGDILSVELDGKINRSCMPEKLEFSYLFKRPLHHQAIFFANDLFKRYGKYNEQITLASDWEYCFRLFLNTDVSFEKIDIAVSFYDNTGSSKQNRAKYYTQMDEVKNNLLSMRLRMYLEESIRNEFIVLSMKKHPFYQIIKRVYNASRSLFKNYKSG